MSRPAVPAYDQTAELDFIYPNDQYALLTGAGLLKMASNNNLEVPDYAALVTPAKAFKGFVIRVAVTIGITLDEAVDSRSIKADYISIG